MRAPAPAAAAVVRPPVAPVTTSRLVSLDALRGFDMFWILGADALVHVLARTWDTALFRGLAAQMQHRDWAGLRFYDLIFPLFAFIVGTSAVFSLSRILAEQGRAEAVKRILFRATLLFLLGIFHQGGLTTPWPGVRIAGVLQTMAVGYAGAGLLFCFFRPRMLAIVGAAILLGYGAVLAFVPIRDIQLEKTAIPVRLGVAKPTLEQVRVAYEATTATVTGRYEPGLNVANHVDFNFLPGRRYDVYYDPEGLLNMISAIATCLMGMGAGLWLRRTDRSERQKTTGLIAAGVVALAVGFLGGQYLPIVKKIWSPTFVLVAGGWSLLLLATFYHLVDVRGWRRWCVPFVWIGMNPITLYLLNPLLSYSRVSQRLFGGSVKAWFDETFKPGVGVVVIAAGALAAMLLLARFLYSRKIFLRV